MVSGLALESELDYDSPNGSYDLLIRTKRCSCWYTRLSNLFTRLLISFDHVSNASCEIASTDIQ